MIGDGVSRGITLLELVNYLNISKENIIDIENDILMLEVSRICFAVGNVRNDKEGVAFYLEKLLNITRNF